SAVWGVTRDDGSQRPVEASLRTAVRNFSGFLQARFAPLVRTPARWAAWPNDPTSLIPNWRVYQVVFDLPDNRRVTVVWSGDGVPLRIRIPRQGSQASVLDMNGDELQGPTPGGQDWVIALPPATAHYSGDPAGYYFIGGEPRLLIQEAVPQDAPVAPPRLAWRRSLSAGFPRTQAPHARVPGECNRRDRKQRQDWQSPIDDWGEADQRARETHHGPQ